MIKIHKILLFIILANFIFGQYETNEMTYEEVFEQQREFINEQNIEFNNSKGLNILDEKQYPPLVARQKMLLNEINACDDCSEAQKSQLSYELYYSFAKNTMLRYGKMIEYKTNLVRAIKILENLISQIKNMNVKDCDSSDKWNQDDCYFSSEVYTSNKKVEKLVKKYNKNLNAYNDELESLSNEYVDIEIYIKHPEEGRFFEDMVGVYDSENFNNPILVSLDVPSIFYDKNFEKKFMKDDDKKRGFKNQKNRVNSLRVLSERLILTAYNKDDGFYFKIPMVPIILERSSKRIRQSGPEYSYAVVITSSNKVEKYRFELTEKSLKKNNNNIIYIDAQEKGWVFEYNKIPFDWTKIEMNDNLNWIYKDSQDIEICSFDKNRKQKIEMNDNYIETFIPIYKSEDNKIYIYQKDVGDLDGYKIEFSQNNRNKIRDGFKKSLKYIFFALLFGVGYAESN